MNIEKIGKFIAFNRKKLNMTQEELGHKLGVTGKTVSRWETGNYMPDLSLLIPLSQTLNITLNELLQGEALKPDKINSQNEEALEATINYSEKTLRQKTKKLFLKLIVSIIIMVIVSFMGYKIYLLNKYNIKKIPEINQVINNFQNYQTIKIATHELEDNAYLVLDNLKIRNDFANYSEINSLTTDSYSIKKWNYKDNTNNSAVMISISAYPFQNFFEGGGELINFGNADLPEINNQDRIAYLYSHNITNEMTFFKFLSKEANYHHNIFTSAQNIRGSYAAWALAAIFANYQISYLEGNYEGYLFTDNTNKIWDCHILKNNLSYNFIFAGPNFSQEYINDLLNQL